MKRQRAILEAAWRIFDAAARGAKGKRLSVGPRGGGRTLAKMAGHVLEAEVAYLGQLGSRHAKPEAGEDELALVRREALDTLDAVTAGRQPANPRNTKKPWAPRYFIRRSAWHSLDHAWELEDRVGG
ncbi:MAG TPA: DinB family protein [Candidatus Limnocylindria bacterium]